MTGGKWGRSNRFSHWDHNNILRILVKLRSFVFVIINHHITYCRNFSLNLLSTESSNSFANRSAVQCWKILVMHCHHNRSVGCNFANPTIWSRDRNGTRPPSQTTHNSYLYLYIFLRNKLHKYFLPRARQNHHCKTCKSFVFPTQLMNFCVTFFSGHKWVHIIFLPTDRRDDPLNHLWLIQLPELSCRSDPLRCNRIALNIGKYQYQQSNTDAAKEERNWRNQSESPRIVDQAASDCRYIK